MDIQKLLDGISASHRQERSRYHLTLGQLTAALEEGPPTRGVRTDTGVGLRDEHSYRGYYADLSFTPSSATTADEVLAACKRAASATYEGWKGGDFTYGPETPLWLAHEGSCGLAIVGTRTGPDGALVLVTKDTGE